MAAPTFSSSSPSLTASLLSSYTPSLATAIASQTGSATSTLSSLTPNPTTPAFADDLSWITAYLYIHMMSAPSYRYAYLLWIAVVFIFVIFAVLHWTGRRGGFIGAYWSKWSLRRRTWRKKHSLAVARKSGQPHKQPNALPSNAQILCLLILVLAVIALCTAGPDYIDPNAHVWDFSQTATVAAVKAARKRAAFDPTVVLSFRAQYTIEKAWWTAGGRTGIVAFALFPLCILFALKAPPFALFALPFMIQIHFDKLVRLHRWSGRLIWVISAAHVVLWGVQLGKDRRPNTDKAPWLYVWDYDKFIYGWVAFGLLTLLVAFSFRGLRTAHYEAFYFLHVLLVPLTLVSSALHHPPIWWWCWAALALWIGERIWRATWYAYVNGYFGGMRALSPKPLSALPPRSPAIAAEKLQKPMPMRKDEAEAWEMGGLRTPEPENQLHRNLLDELHIPTSPTQRSSPIPGSQSRRQSAYSGKTAVHVTSPTASSSRMPQPSTELYAPPPGYAHAVLLPGRTVRLRLITPEYISWAPGQHFLLNIPAVSRFTTHPFTVASVCDEQAPTDAGRELVLLVRAKAGWTKRLWDEVAALSARGLSAPERERIPAGHGAPVRGVLLRTLVDGPFGSAARARWGAYSTVLIVAGGSGVSFGMSIMQYLCLCLAGRDGKTLGGRPGGWGQTGFRTRRVRFVWLVREFSHVQWCASTIRQCMALVSSESLEINICVSNYKPTPRYPSLAEAQQTSENTHLVPPTPQFARQKNKRSNSVSSVESNDSLVDLSYYFSGEDGDIERGEGELGHEEHVLDYTNFDGDDDTHMPGETQLSQKLRKEGRLRRARSRMTSGARVAKQQLEERAAEQHNRKRSSVRSTDLLISPNSPPLSPLSEDSHGHHFGSLHDEPDDPPHLRGPMTGTSLLAYDSAADRGRKPTPKHLPPSFVNSASSSRAPSIISSYSQSGTDTGHSLGMHDGPREDDLLRLDVDPQEAYDLRVVSEMVRPGKPRLDRILADEVERSRGAVVVACCGPPSLNALMRKSIAAQINPQRVLHGDHRGTIAFVSEEFEY